MYTITPINDYIYTIKSLDGKPLPFVFATGEKVTGNGLTISKSELDSFLKQYCAKLTPLGEPLQLHYSNIAKQNPLKYPPEAGKK